MEKQVIIVEYTGEEPNKSALENVITGLGLAGTTVCTNPKPTIAVLSETEAAQALYAFSKSPSKTKKVATVEIERTAKEDAAKNIAAAIINALKNV